MVNAISQASAQTDSTLPRDSKVQSKSRVRIKFALETKSIPSFAFAIRPLLNGPEELIQNRMLSPLRGKLYDYDRLTLPCSPEMYCNAGSSDGGVASDSRCHTVDNRNWSVAKDLRNTTLYIRHPDGDEGREAPGSKADNLQNQSSLRSATIHSEANNNAVMQAAQARYTPRRPCN